MEEMAQFRRNAARLGLCDTYTSKWDNCGSKKQLFQLACDTNGIQYMADMCSRGYGLSADYICREFGQFINGRCIVKQDGYSSCVYCRPDNDVHVTTTAALIIECDKDIVIDKSICKIYLVNSHCRVIGEGRALAYLYNSAITNNATASAIIKENR